MMLNSMETVIAFASPHVMHRRDDEMHLTGCAKEHIARGIART